MDGAVLLGLQDFLHVSNVALVVMGVGIGVIFGGIPGLNAIIGVTLALPFTFYMSPSEALCLLAGIYKGGVYAGSIPAILLNIPGAPEAAATAADGNAMALAGKGKKALHISLYASVVGSLAGDLALIILAAWLAQWALQVGPAEMFCLIVFALSIIGSVSGRSLPKGIIAGLLGLLVATIGMDTMTGVPRFTFGLYQLAGGIPFLGMLMGLFALSEILIQAEQDVGRIRAAAPRTSIRPAGDRLTWKEFVFCLPTMARSSILGVIIGAIPGPGATTGAFVSYATARQFSKQPEKFGAGAIEGVAAPDSGNNATCGATLIPLLTLGIPGSPIAAVLGGALMIHGIDMGPSIFMTDAVTVYSFYFGMLAASLALIGVGLIALRFAVRFVATPRPILYAVVLTLCYTGTYMNSSSIFELAVLTAFGVIGYIMRKAGLSIAAFIIAVILAPTMETSFKQALLISGGDWTPFVASPIAVSFLLLTVLSIVLISRQRRRLKALGF